MILTPAFKIFATVDEKIFRNAAQPMGFPGGLQIIQQQQKKPDFVKVGHTCQCGTVNQFYVKFKDDPLIDDKMKKEGIEPFPIGNKYSCKCGTTNDLTKIRSDIKRMRQ